MRKLAILVICIYMAFPLNVWAVTYTASVSGNYSNSATWGGSNPTTFTTSDTVVVNKGVTVVQDVSINNGGSYNIGAITVGANAGALSGLAVFQQYSGVTTNLTGKMTVGNGTTADGQLTFGKSATLGLSAQTLELNNAKLRSNATTGSWAKVTGTGAITMGAVHSAPKQDIDLSYVSFQNSGNIVFAAGGTSGTGLTNQVNVLHNVFSGTGTITFGQAGWTPSATPISVTYNDFRDVGNIVLTGGVGAATTPFTNNTVSNTTEKTLTINSRHGGLVSNNVLSNITWGISSSSAPTLSDNFICKISTGARGSGVIAINEAVNATSILRNYIYEDWENPHTIGRSSTGGTGTHDCGYNVVEEVYAFNQPDFFSSTVMSANLHHNLRIGEGAMSLTTTNLVTSATLNIYNNTSFRTTNKDAGYGQLWYDETGGPWGGTLNIYNNIVQNKTGLATTTTNRAVNDFFGAQPVVKLGWNNVPGLTTPYSEVVISNNQTANDKAVNSQFVDENRNLAAWGAAVGADGTVTGAKNKLLAINGYDSTTKTQKTPSGVVVSGTQMALLDWVRAGFAPTNPLLVSSGEGGVYMGAVTPVIGVGSLKIWGLGFGL